jgi:hypothetical protein
MINTDAIHAPSKRRGEFCNAKGLATPIIDIYL